MALTPRETQVTSMIAKGLSVDEIARRLGISADTVRTYAHNVKLRERRWETPTRENEVSSLLAKGKSHNEIARILGISVHTVRAYVQRAKLRTGCRSSLELAVKSAMAGALHDD